MSAPALSNPTTVAAPVGAYSQVAKIAAGSEIFYFAGQVGMRPDGSAPEDFAEQCEEAFANIARLLAAEGLTTANLVKLNVYIVQGSPLAELRAARMRHMGDARPASTLIFVPQLFDPKYKIEIEAVACR